MWAHNSHLGDARATEMGRQGEWNVGLPGSYEALFHETGFGNFMLFPRDAGHLGVELDGKLQRAIGVIYLPETERASHYFRADLSRQFDAMIHFDETRALTALDRTGGRIEEEAPETFPTGV